MIRTTVPTSVRKGTALAGVAGLLVLAGCSGTADAEDQSTDTGTCLLYTSDAADE